MIELLRAINAADAWIACVALGCATFLTVYFTHKEDK